MRFQYCPAAKEGNGDGDDAKVFVEGQDWLHGIKIEQLSYHPLETNYYF